jgi:hypothetical protein
MWLIRVDWSVWVKCLPLVFIGAIGLAAAGVISWLAALAAVAYLGAWTAWAVWQRRRKSS